MNANQIMKTESTPYQPEPDYNDRRALLHYLRREALANGSLGRLYLALGDILYDDPEEALRYFEAKLDEELDRNADRMFIEGTPIFRTVPKQAASV
jgi:hypothetical protein